VIDVIVADDHQLFVDGVTQALGALPDMRVIGRVGDGEALLELLTRRHPDVLLLDIDMPGMTGLEVLNSLDPPPPTLVVSMHVSDGDRQAAMEAGAMGFLSKGVPLSDLAAAIRAVDAGEALDDAAVLAAVLDRHRAARLDPGAAALTERERELLRLLAKGVTATDEMADALYISQKTVKNHLANIYAKLGVSDRAQAAVEAIRLGLVSRDE
jgi:DNA-binding NarL/FixJ family response regulator